MINIDLFKAGATTILSCGTTNAGHYAIVQQGLNSWVEHETAKKIYEFLAKEAPNTPGDKWLLYGIELRDYKGVRNKFYKIYAEYKFRRDTEKYSNEVKLSPEQAKTVYDIFREAAQDQRS